MRFRGQVRAACYRLGAVSESREGIRSEDQGLEVTDVDRGMLTEAGIVLRTETSGKC